MYEPCRARMRSFLLGCGLGGGIFARVNEQLVKQKNGKAKERRVRK